MLVSTKKVVKTRNGNLQDYTNQLFVWKGGKYYMKDNEKEALKLLKLTLLCLLFILVIWLLK